METSLLIRADAGGVNGTGHVMRMIALAQAYQRRGGQVVFICAQLPKALEHRLIQEDCEVIRISAEPGSSEDVQATLAVLSSQFSVSGFQSAESDLNDSGQDQPPITDHRKPITGNRPPNTGNWLVVDGYHFGYDYQKCIKKAGLRLMCVDDHGYSDRWHCDAILNQNLDAERRIEYQSDFPDTKILVGSMFCLLREEFLNAKAAKTEWGKIESLLVTLGGSDPENATEATLQLLNRACGRPLKIRVLAGADNPHIERLQSFESQHQIEVVQNATNMPEQYACANGIISAGGSTCWEWLYLGLPGAIVTIAENQLPIVKALTEDRRAALPLGWFNDSDFGANVKQLSEWIDAPAQVCNIRIAEQIVDGNGAGRVAEILV